MKLELATLEHQLVEQERCHLEQISSLEQERRQLYRENGSIREQFKVKIDELAKQ